VREKEEEAKLEAEIALLEDKKGVELKALQAILAPKGLTFKQIKADGHCLYRSVSDQLSKQPEQKQYSWEQLRTLAAATLRANEATYAPFLFAEKDDVDFELYCEELEHGTRDGKVVWGGQVELIALSRALGTPILVYNAKNQEAIDSSTEGDDRRGGESTPLLLTFHEHYFGLGAHYNSCEAVM
jgi:OTU domain-containing protein 6